MAMATGLQGRIAERSTARRKPNHIFLCMLLLSHAANSEEDSILDKVRGHLEALAKQATEPRSKKILASLQSITDFVIYDWADREGETSDPRPLFLQHGAVRTHDAFTVRRLKFDKSDLPAAKLQIW